MIQLDGCDVRIESLIVKGDLTLNVSQEIEETVWATGVSVTQMTVREKEAEEHGRE